jgi:hypothetical protein
MRKLPTFEEIVNSDLSEKNKEDALFVLLNQCPPPQWVKTKNRVPYLPIDKQEYLLSKIFGTWETEVKSVQLIANSIVVTINVAVKHPLTDVRMSHDGVGAAPIQTKSGHSPTDFEAILNDAIQKGAPAAESFAFKDAAEKFGRLFGKDLSRSDVIAQDHIDRALSTFENAQLTEK